jgi:hypothetical protein
MENRMKQFFGGDNKWVTTTWTVATWTAN